MQNSIVGNEVSESGVADLGFGSLQTDLASLGNCFGGNTFTTTAPTDLEGLAPCEGEPTATDWAANALDLIALMGAEKPPSVDYETAPTPERSEEHTSELPSLMRISYAVFFLKTKKASISIHE